MTLPAQDIVERLFEAMNGVTPGPWQVYDGCSWRRIGTAPSKDRPRYDDCAVLSPTKASDGHPDLDCSRGNDRDANLAYIALCSPDNIGALLDTISRVTAENEALRKERDTCAEAAKMAAKIGLTHSARADALVQALRAIVDTLDAEEMGEGPPASEWSKHWQKLHDDARAALGDRP